MTTVGQRLHLRLFLEGVEVPVISATVQSQPNAPAVASIQIPANDYALDLKPRTLVHLFFFDLYNGGPARDVASVRGAGIQAQDNVDPDIQSVLDKGDPGETELTLTDLENQNYRLLFGGEVMGLQFAKQPMQRSIVLQCADWSSYWDIAFQYQGGGNLFGPGLRASFTGASTSLFSSFLDGSGDIVYRLFSTPPRSYPEMRGTLLGGLMHILEAIGGIYFGERAVRGHNDFFSLAEMRLHITQMVGANPYAGRDEVRLLSARGFGSIFSRSLSGLGKQVSVRAVLNALQKYVFHEVVPITTPKFIPGAPTNNGTTQTTTLANEPDLAPIKEAATQVKNKALSYMQRLDLSTDTPSAQQQSGQDLARATQRLARDCDLINRRVRRIMLATDRRGQVRFSDPSASNRISAVFAISGSNFNSIYTILEVANRGQTPFVFPLPNQPEHDRIKALLTQVSKLMDEVLDVQLLRRQSRGTRQPYPPPRLLTQIYRPDVWMVAPPRCNVIFPELYSQLQWGRSMMEEPTRLLLRTHDAFFGSDALFDGYYFSPSRVTGARAGRRLGGGRVGAEPPDLSDAPAGFIRDLMDHELYTGILPVFERMSDLNLHALRGGYIEIDGVRFGFAQLAANHIFFQRRFASRQLQVSGKFNPYVVLGFPAVVIDRYMPESAFLDPTRRHNSSAAVAETLRDGEGQESARTPEDRERIRQANDDRIAEAERSIFADRPLTHYLGTPQALIHTCSAQGPQGTTQIQMAYARTTNETTEFLGDSMATTTNTTRLQRNSRVTTDVAAFVPPVVGAKGFRGGRIASVEDVTDRYQRRAPTRVTNRNSTGQNEFVGGTRLPLYIPDRTYAGRQRRATQVLVGVTQPAASYGPEVVALVGTVGETQTGTGESTVDVSFRAYKIVEQIGVYTRQVVNLPPEELTFPPWYGEQYRTGQIGGLYSYYFGTGAITDPTTVTGPGGPPARIVGDPSATSQANINVTTSSAAALAPLDDNTNQPGAPALNISGGGIPGPPGDPTAEPNILGEVTSRSPIANAVEQLVRIYSQVKHKHLDVDQFIGAYTYRPIASMLDMFGTADLEIDDQGNVTRGVEGFHSRAFGDYDDLRTLIAAGEGGQPPTILGLHVYDPNDVDRDEAQPTRDATISARLDTRKEKRLFVLKYLYGMLYVRGVG